MSQIDTFLSLTGGPKLGTQLGLPTVFPQAESWSIGSLTHGNSCQNVKLNHDINDGGMIDKKDGGQLQQSLAMFQSKDDNESKKQSIIFLTDFHAEYCFLYSPLQTLRHSDIFEVVTSLRTKCGTCHELSKVKTFH